MFIGNDQRVAFASIETWERLHGEPATGDGSRVELIEAREKHKAPKARSVVTPPKPGGIVAAWKKMRAAG
jgi:hypothetical protein